MIQSGAVIFTLPRVTAAAYGTNGWLALLPISLIVIFNIYIISFVYKLGEGRDIFSIMESAIPKILLFPLYIFLIIVWSLLGCMVVNYYVNLFQLVALPGTPQYLLKLILSLVAFLFVIKGIYNMVKATTIFFILTIWTVIVVLFLFPKFEISRFTPYLFRGDTAFITGGLDIYSSFLGYELVLLLFPFVDRKTKLFKAVVFGTLMTTTVYIIVCITAYGFYSFEHLLKLRYPVINMLAYVELPFMERLESLIFSFFIMKIIVTTGLFYWVASETLQRLLPKIPNSLAVFIVILFSYLISFIPNTMNEVMNWLTFLANIEIGITFILPLLLITILVIKKSKQSERNTNG